MENILKDISRFSGDFSGNPGNTPADERIFSTTGFIGLYCGIRQFMKAISPVIVSFFFFHRNPAGRRTATKFPAAGRCRP